VSERGGQVENAACGLEDAGALGNLQPRDVRRVKWAQVGRHIRMSAIQEERG